MELGEGSAKMDWFDRHFRLINTIGSVGGLAFVAGALYLRVERRTLLIALALVGVNILIGLAYPYISSRYNEHWRHRAGETTPAPRQVARWAPYALVTCLAMGVVLVFLTYIVWNGSWLPLLLGLGLFGISTAVVATQWR